MLSGGLLVSVDILHKQPGLALHKNESPTRQSRDVLDPAYKFGPERFLKSPQRQLEDASDPTEDQGFSELGWT
jgi:hypothetical protein